MGLFVHHFFQKQTTNGNVGLRTSVSRPGKSGCAIMKSELDNMIQIKRVYDPVAPQDGHRFLVDRLWPRGIKKEKLALDAWLKELAPRDNLRHWYAHDPAKWDEFCHRYFTELDANPETWRIILDAASQGYVTLLFSSKELKLNNAVALKLYLEAHHQ
jgi:uncharacterized protein YeaO (DUF488 family)